MLNAAVLKDNYDLDMWVSPESQTLFQSSRRLLQFGREKGFATSYAEDEAIVRPDQLALRFQHHVQTWRNECTHLPSVREMVLHPAYQHIIGMGEPALPLILAELEARPDHWFWALKAITGEDATLPENRGNVAEMAKDWLGWAKNRGIPW